MKTYFSRQIVFCLIITVLAQFLFEGCISPKVVINESYDGEFVSLKRQKEVFIFSYTSMGKTVPNTSFVLFDTLEKRFQPGDYEVVARYGPYGKSYYLSFRLYTGFRYYLHFDNTLDPQELILDEFPENEVKNK